MIAAIIIILLAWIVFELRGLAYLLETISNKMAARHSITTDMMSINMHVSKIREWLNDHSE